MKKHKLIILVCLMLVGTTCLMAQVQYGKTVRGIASFYSDKFEGRKMANGEPYRRDSFTCAHLHYSFGTLLMVRNVANDKECVVRVTDRGPYSRKYTIDLSKAAARHLDFLGRGHTTVDITPVWGEGVAATMEEDIDESDGISDLFIDFAPIATYPYPAWKND